MIVFRSHMLAAGTAVLAEKQNKDLSNTRDQFRHTR